MYLMRLDDASEYMDIEKWLRMETLLDKYDVKPLFGIIPDNQDSDLLSYEKVENFWELVVKWIAKGWIPALHGCTHVFETEDGGINPVNRKSEFAGLPYKEQSKKIVTGYRILKDNEIEPQVFFAPAHTFDDNTINALIDNTPIRVISDTPANRVYNYKGITFIPQQSGLVRSLPFHTTTFCYHPNNTTNEQFYFLEQFLKTHKFGEFSLSQTKREKSAIDRMIAGLYYWRHR